MKSLPNLRMMSSRCTGPSRPCAVVLLSVLLRLIQPHRAAAEDRIEYRWENYAEDGNRMDIRTHAAYAEAELNSKVTVRGQFVYDSISGASPTGGPPEFGSTRVPVNGFPIQDIRRAGSIEAAIRWARNQLTTPQVAYSVESDYESFGIALNHSMEFNQRNTTVTVGVAHNFDRVSGSFQTQFEDKDTTDVLLGLNQLLGPNTHVTANLTIGHAGGYLEDPYKGVNFYFPYPGTGPIDWLTDVNSPESRPDGRLREVVYLALNHFVKPMHGAIESSYRFSHDDFGILAHTFSVQWMQKLGRSVTVSPVFRYHRQSAADFYATRFIGDPSYPEGTHVAYQDGEFVDFEGGPAYPEDTAGFDIITVPRHPRYFSADYRLSELEAFTFGVGVQWRIQDHVTLDAAYKRYEMGGLDGVTSGDAYPKAHVFTIGLGIRF